MEKTGVLTTAVRIDDNTAKHICARAEAFLHESGIVWSRTIDPAIIGGFVVRVGDREVNMGINSQLASIAGKLSE